MRRPLGAAAALLLICFTASTATAAEAGRGEYVERIEPICKVNTEANERILAGVRGEMSRGHLTAAAAKFAKAAAALGKTRTQLLAVTPPSGDQAQVSKWLSGVKGEVELLEATARKLSAGDKLGAQKQVVKLTANANRLNTLMVNFEFHYCRFEPAKYT
jgi:hypothetical protein